MKLSKVHRGDIDRTSQAVPGSMGFTEWERLSLEGSEQVNDML